MTNVSQLDPNTKKILNRAFEAAKLTVLEKDAVQHFMLSEEKLPSKSAFRRLYPLTPLTNPEIDQLVESARTKLKLALAAQKVGSIRDFLL